METDLSGTSPTPWRVSEQGGAVFPGSHEIRIVDADNVVICYMESSRNKRVQAQARATAEMIVTLANKASRKVEAA